MSAPTIVTPLAVRTTRPGTDPTELPPRGEAPMSMMTDPGRMAATASPDTSSGGRRPGTWAVVITMS